MLEIRTTREKKRKDEFDVADHRFTTGSPSERVGSRHLRNRQLSEPIRGTQELRPALELAREMQFLETCRACNTAYLPTLDLSLVCESSCRRVPHQPSLRGTVSMESHRGSAKHEWSDWEITLRTSRVGRVQYHERGQHQGGEDSWS